MTFSVIISYLISHLIEMCNKYVLAAMLMLIGIGGMVYISLFIARIKSAVVGITRDLNEYNRVVETLEKTCQLPHVVKFHCDVADNTCVLVSKTYIALFNDLKAVHSNYKVDYETGKCVDMRMRPFDMNLNHCIEYHSLVYNNLYYDY